MSINPAHPVGQKTTANTADAVDAPSLEVEPLTALLELAAEVLGTHCRPDENFFDHGDSMAAAHLCALAARRYGWTITPRDVFAWESFALLAGMIEQDRRTAR